MDGHGGSSGVEVLVFELPELTAVDRVGKFGTELLHVEEIGTATHLFIRGEADGERSMGSVGVLVQVLHKRHNLRHARLVVGTEQRGAVSHDKVVANMLRKRGEVLLVEHHTELLVDDDGATLIVLDDAGVHALAARLGCGVHMGDETDCRSGSAFGKIGGDMPHYVAVLIDARVFHAEGPQLLDQHIRKIPLACSARDGFLTRAGLRIDPHIAQKTLFNRFHTSPLIQRQPSP